MKVVERAYRSMEHLMRTGLPKAAFDAVNDDPPGEAARSLVSQSLNGYHLALYDNIAEGGCEHVFFNYCFENEDPEQGEITAAILAVSYHGGYNCWTRVVESDDGFVPDPIMIAAKTLGMSDMFFEEEVTEERALADVRLLVSMFREKSGLGKKGE